MASDPVFVAPLAVVVAALVVAALVVAALIWRGGWRVALGLIALVFAAGLVLALYVTGARQVVVTPPPQTIAAPLIPPVAPPAPPKPVIELDGPIEAVSKVPADEDLELAKAEGVEVGDEADEPKSKDRPLPDWVGKQWPEGWAVLEVGPSASTAGLRESTREEVTRWLAPTIRTRHGEQGIEAFRRVLEGDGLDAAMDQFRIGTNLRWVTTSVGQMYQRHLLMRLTEDGRKWIDAVVAQSVAQQGPTPGLLRVMGFGAAVLLLLAVTHLLLRGDSRSPAGA